MPHSISRRTALAALSAGTTVAPLLSSSAAADGSAQPAAAAQTSGQCVLFPQAVEGPYYFDPKLVRADIREGRPGADLKLTLKLIDAADCTPIANARIDVWHADAGGVYSGYARQGDDRSVSTEGQHYLRGTQMTAADGSVTFQTILPGWYPGRTPHIHVKAFLDQTEMVTGQVYFPDEFTKRIYASREPYSARPTPDQTNATDGLFQDGQRDGGGIVLTASEEASTLVAALLISVDRSGKAAAKQGGLFATLKRMLGF